MIDPDLPDMMRDFRKPNELSNNDTRIRIFAYWMTMIDRLIDNSIHAILSAFGSQSTGDFLNSKLSQLLHDNHGNLVKLMAPSADVAREREDLKLRITNLQAAETKIRTVLSS